MKFKSHLDDIKSVRIYIVNSRTHEVLHSIDGADHKYSWVDNLNKTSTTTPITFFSEKEAEKIARKNVVDDSFYFVDKGGLTRELYNEDGSKI